jgi:Ni,Fe-hydrogenase III small subunit
MLKTLRQIGRVGIVTESPPSADPALRLRTRLQARILGVLGRALCIRAIDAGSCNGCELEIQALANPFYNLEGLGIRFVASPRHADMLLVTGPVTSQMRVPLERAYAATPDPKLVVAIGECACSGGIFATGAACVGRVANVIPVDVAVAGCPPSPERILSAILTAITATGDAEPSGSVLSTPT